MSGAGGGAGARSGATRELLRSPGLRYAAEIFLCAALAFLAFAVDSDILTADLRAPTCWLMDGDGVSFAGMHFKGTLDNGWYTHNRFLGAPFGASFEDFPAPDLFYLGLIKLVSTLTGDWVVTWNVVNIAGYPLAGAAAFAVIRAYGVRLPAALACGVLFALIPFHQFRIYGHAPYGLTYWGVPLAVVPALEILRGSSVLFRAPERPRAGWRRALPHFMRDRLSIGLLVIAALAGLWGYVYFTFFAIVTYALAGLVQAVRTRGLLPLYRAAAVVGAAGLAFVVQNAGTLAHLRAQGRVPIALRSPSDSELFALKLSQLVMPMSGHRVEALRDFRRAYDASAPLVNENGTAYLGLIGGVGFFVLLVVLARGPRGVSAGASAGESACASASTTDLLWPLAVASFVAFLLGTMGGLGSLIAYAGFPDIRSYNRISVYIGFYALFAVAILLDLALARARDRATRAVGVLAMAALTFLGVYDQTFEGVPDYPAFGRVFREDRAFVERVEAALPPDAQVFQLPYMSFPEGGPTLGVPDYAHLAPYLHSKKLRFSYGALRARIGDERYRELARTPLPELADALTTAGYAAVWIDPRGFEDGGKILQDELRETLGEPLAVGPRGVAVWSLVEHRRVLQERLGPELERRAREWHDRPFLGFNDGFYVREANDNSYWYTARGPAKLFLTNPADHPQRLVLDVHYRTASPVAPPTTLFLDSDLAREALPVDPANHHLEKVLEVPPGTHVLRFRTDAVTAPTEVDPRRRVFILQEPRLRPAP